jgi:hypothetical protein
VERFSIYKGSSSNQRLFLWRSAPNSTKVLLYIFIERKFNVGRWWVTTALVWINHPHRPRSKSRFSVSEALTAPYPQK